LLSLLDAKSEHVAFDASKHTLAIAGIKPPTEPSLNVNLSVRAGFVVDLSEPDQQAKPGEIITGGADVAKIVDAEL
jgi:hypothetical protein